jgi:hypothetical protein
MRQWKRCQWKALWTQLVFVFVLCLCIFVSGAQASTDAAPKADEHGKKAEEAKPATSPLPGPSPVATPASGHTPPAVATPSPAAAPKVTPWPRRVLFPNPGLRNAPGFDRPPPWNPRDWRFSVLVTLASWNPKSEEMVQWMSHISDVFSVKKVLVLGVFSHDTAESIERFAVAQRPRFPAGVASSVFLKSFGNPKVPTVWIVNVRGEIVTRKELPDETERKRLQELLALWTDF